MAEMGKYCKAVPREAVPRVPGLERERGQRPEGEEGSGRQGGREVERQLNDDSILYLQENYIVTDGIFKDQNIIFDNVTDEWKQFCHSTLAFEIPVYEPIEIKHAEPVASGT